MSLLVADVRALDAGEFESLVVFGGAALDDGGGGLYYWDAASTNADDGAEWIKPTSVDAGSPGRWHRIEPYALPTHTHAGMLTTSDVDDTAVNGATTAPVSSNWAFDHSALTTAHGGPYNLYTHPNHSGDVTSVADGATTIATGVVTNAKLANVATSTIKGRTTAATGVPEDLTAAQTRTLLNVDEIGTARPPASHTHGNITNVGAVGTTANLPLITTTSGVIIASSFGTGANTFCQGNDTRLHAAVTVSGTPNYVTLSGQDLVRGLVNLTSHVTGLLPAANIGVLTTVTNSAATRTNTLADRSNWVRWTSTSAKTFTIASTTGAADGDVWQGINVGTNTLTLQGSGVGLTGVLTFATGKSYSIRFTSATAADVVGGA